MAVHVIVSELLSVHTEHVYEEGDLCEYDHPSSNKMSLKLDDPEKFELRTMIVNTFSRWLLSNKYLAVSSPESIAGWHLSNTWHGFDTNKESEKLRGIKQACNSSL